MTHINRSFSFDGVACPYTCSALGGKNAEGLLPAITRFAYQAQVSFQTQELVSLSADLGYSWLQITADLLGVDGAIRNSGKR